jgi:hypothetical protein
MVFNIATKYLRAAREEYYRKKYPDLCDAEIEGMMKETKKDPLLLRTRYAK